MSHKILIISKYASSKEYGFETRLFAIARRIVTTDSCITIISSDSNHFGKFPNFKKIYNFENISGIETFWIKTLKYVKTVSILRVLSWIDFEIKLLFFPTKKIFIPDVIIVSSLSILTILNGVRLKNKYKCKLIFEIRDIWPLTLTEEGGVSKYNPFVLLLSFVEKFGYEKSDLVVGTMPNLLPHIQGITKKSVQFSCIPFGFSLKDYENNYSSPNFSWIEKIPNNRLIIGYAGSIGLTNGLETFVNVIKMCENSSSVFFVILGDGDLKQKFVKELENNSNVVFLPKVNRHEVRFVLQKCDVLYFSALNSRVWEYGWSPNKLIDYMLSGKPILASYSGFVSMINEAQSGFIVPSSDESALFSKINEISLLPSEMLTEMGERGRKWIIENRQWETLASEYLKILNSLKD